jgi:hypothetical protein
MALFKTSPEKSFARDIANATANRDRLRLKLGEVETAIVGHKAQAQTAARDGKDDSVLDLAEGLVRSAQDRRETIKAALVEVESQLSSLEREKNEAQDRATREATAQSVELLARRVIESADVMVKAAAAFADHIAKAAAFIPESNGLLNFALIVQREVPAAVAQTATLLRAHREQVLAGSAPATLAAPPEAYIPPPVAPPPPTTSVFSLTPIKYKSASGEQIVVQAHQDAVMPPATAAKAFRLGVVTKLDDPRRVKLHGSIPGHPNPKTALDLDAAEEKPEPERTSGQMHSAFEKPVVGPAQILKIAR